METSWQVHWCFFVKPRENIIQIWSPGVLLTWVIVSIKSRILDTLKCITHVLSMRGPRSEWAWITFLWTAKIDSYDIYLLVKAKQKNNIAIMFIIIFLKNNAGIVDNIFKTILNHSGFSRYAFLSDYLTDLYPRFFFYNFSFIIEISKSEKFAFLVRCNNLQPCGVESVIYSYLSNQSFLVIFFLIFGRHKIFQFSNRR